MGSQRKEGTQQFSCYRTGDEVGRNRSQEQKGLDLDNFLIKKKIKIQTYMSFVVLLTVAVDFNVVCLK